MFNAGLGKIVEPQHRIQKLNFGLLWTPYIISSMGIHAIPVLYSSDSEFATAFCFSFIIRAQKIYVWTPSGSIMNFGISN